MDHQEIADESASVSGNPQDVLAVAAPPPAPATNGTLPTVSSLAVSIDGKPALVRYDDEYLFVHRGSSSEKGLDPSTAYLCVPLALVLHASFVPDSDGGSLLVRLLTPPLKGRSALAASLAPPRSSLHRKGSRGRKVSANGSITKEADAKQQTRREKLRAQLEGPCASLRLLKIEARLSPSSTVPDVSLVAPGWATKLMSLAYTSWGVSPHRRLKVIINPIGGPGKAGPLFETRVRPILEAAGCRLDVQYTTHKDHGVTIARELELDKFDALVCVSGDGMLHEVLNGLAQRTDAKNALESLPVVPIPAGSGNAMSVNLFGPQLGFSLALASLNAIKGRPMRLDVCNVTQPKEGGGYTRYYSFLSQAIGLMADLDLGTEDLRALGDARFIVGFVSGVLKNRACDMELDLLFGDEGGIDKRVMRQRALERDQDREEKDGVEKMLGSSSDTDESQVLPPLKYGSVVTPLTDLPLAPTEDPSFPTTSAPSATTSSQPSAGWHRFPLPLSSLYGGKIPYVSRDLMQFPFARPSDGHIDLCLMLHSSGRLGKLRAIGSAESGAVVYDRGAVYARVRAFRCSPILDAGDRRLRKGGLIAIDGEKVPWQPFQVEVADGLEFNVLSLYGRLCVPDVPPPPGVAKHAAAAA